MTTITNPADPMVQAKFLKIHLKLMAKGLKHSRMSGTTLLGKVSALTGRTYKRGQYQTAIDDLNTMETHNG
jgi:hypothetical protein